MDLYNRYLLSRRIRSIKNAQEKEKTIMTFSAVILTATLWQVFQGRH